MRYPFLVLGALAVVIATPQVALAQAAAPAPSDQIVLSGDVLVPRGTVVGEVVVFSGSATVAGVVRGDVVVLDGPVTISGQVGGDVVGLGGPVRLGSTAQVTGNVLASGPVVQEDGAQVGGTIRRDVRFTMAGPTAAFGSLLASVAIAVSVLLLLLVALLLAPRGLERVAESAHTSPVRSGLGGLASWLLVPIAGVVAAATEVGLPLALAVLLGIALLWLLGLAVTSFAIGRLFVRAPGSRVGALFAGWGVTAAVGLVPVLNAAWWILASMFGIGALVVAMWRSRHGTPLAQGGRGGRHRRSSRRPPVAAPSVDAEPSADAEQSEAPSVDAELTRSRDMPVAED